MSGVKGMKRTPEHNAKIGSALKARGGGLSPTKVCPRCKEEKPRSAFRARPNGYTASYCVPCKRSYSAERARIYREQHPELRPKMQESNRRTVLKIKYGLTLEQFEAMRAEQGGVCAICKRPPTRDRLNLDVDHCHATGRVRGLLCSHCNRALGYLSEDPARLRAAAEYVERHAATSSFPRPA